MKFLTYRKPHLLVFLALLVMVLILIWRNRLLNPADRAAGSPESNQQSAIHSSGGAGGLHSGGYGMIDRQRPMRNPSGDGDGGSEVLQFPLIDRVLADESLSVEQAARELRMIVRRADAPLIEREEALAHGLNLDFSQFTDLAEDRQLPQPLALRLFDHMLNENQSRNLQVRMCLDLMDHENEEIRSEACEQLAFYVGLEELTDQPDVIRLEAAAYLEDWAKQPPPDPEPEESPGLIPETAPIEVVEDRDEEE